MKYIILPIFLIFISFNLQAQDAATPVTDTTSVAVVFPKAVGHVNDFEGLFTQGQVDELEKIISDFKAKTGNEIAVASISSIQPYEKFDEYANALTTYWKFETGDIDNGLTIVFSKTLRQIRVSTGLATETKLTDEECKKIIDGYIIPEFKKGNFYEGVKAGVKELISRWE